MPGSTCSTSARSRRAAGRRSAAEETERLVPAIEGLEATELPISADTFSPGVAAYALTAGAVAITTSAAVPTRRSSSSRRTAAAGW